MALIIVYVGQQQRMRIGYGPLMWAINVKFTYPRVSAHVGLHVKSISYVMQNIDTMGRHGTGHNATQQYYSAVLMAN